jgi:two-component system sensor histidine kinase DesK
MRISQCQGTPGQLMETGRPSRTQPAEEVIASSGITFHLWRLYQHAWLICLIFPLVSLVSESLSPWRLMLGLVALVGFAVCYSWLMWPHPASPGARKRAQSRISLVVFVAMSMLVFVFSLSYGLFFLWLFIGTSAIAGLLLPMRSAFAAVVLFTLIPLLLTVDTYGGITGVDWWWLIALMLLVRGLGLDMIGVARMGSAIRELHSARRELARLAVIEERERLSRDLHDVLGQTLSMITLKSELVGHLIKEDPDRCAQELSEIERVARKSLREVREAVAGYREPRLESELEGARQLLEAAGIDYQIDLLKVPLPPACDAVFAWTVREGVTNVIRHSSGRRCCISLAGKNGRVYVKVLSEGGRREQVVSKGRPGLGLVGLRERVSAVGGKIEAGPVTLEGKECFRVCVELPLKLDAGTAVLEER